MTILVEPWEVTRAADSASRLRDSVTAGVEGADQIPATVNPADYPAASDTELRRVAYALFGALINVQEWRPVVFLNAWSNFNTAIYNNAAYFKDPFGVVHLRGFVTRGSPGLGVPIFNLPADYRPIKNTNFAVVANGRFGRLEIAVGGDVLVSVADSGTPEGYVSLDGLTFDARI